MKTIIAGSRSITDIKYVEEAVKASGFHIDTVISGGARGVDRLGEEHAKNHQIPVEIYKADWNNYGRQAGYIRNIEMSKVADSLIAVWDGVSGGTKHIIETMKKLNKPVFIHYMR